MFVFEAHTHNMDCLVLFLGQYSNASKSALVGEVQKAYSINLTPEAIFFVYPLFLAENIKTLLADESFMADLKRYKKSPVVSVSFDGQGNFRSSDNPANLKLDERMLALDIIKSGFQCFMATRVNDVLVKAPSGTVFSKPSGKILEEFIYASQLARTSCENQFLAMSLLRYAPTIEDIDCIYIDTAGISAIAEALTDYITRFCSLTGKYVRYTSFSSYSGVEKSKPDNADGAWVIISASATMSMGKNIVNDWRLKPSQVVTVLSYQQVLMSEASNNGNAVVFCVDEFSKRDDKAWSPTRVKVQGENFSAEMSKPNQVLIKQSHKPNSIGKSIYPYCEGGVFSVNRGGRNLYVDYLQVNKVPVEDPAITESKSSLELKEWMLQIASWSVPRNLSAVIVGPEDVDEKIYSDFELALEQCEFDFSKISKIRPDADMEAIGDGAVLVLSPVITSGNCFVDINRSLRLAGHKGMRIFVTVFVTAQSEKQHRNFKISLKRATNGFSYSFHSYRTMYIGSKANSTWIAEKNFITKMLEDKDEDFAGRLYWDARKDILSKSGVGLKGLIGVPYQDEDSLFELAKDFVFWPKEYEDKPSFDLEAVYATVSAIFQNLRDNTVAGDSLKSNIYQHNVLAPENFVRFNDSILQVCLWRCAAPDELDYRASADISNDFQRVLSKIMFSCRNARQDTEEEGTRGKVALDILLAIALRWIKLTDDALVKVVDDAQEYMKLEHAQILISEIRKELQVERKKVAAGVQ
jgi:hypothetical protein